MDGNREAGAGGFLSGRRNALYPKAESPSVLSPGVYHVEPGAGRGGLQRAAEGPAPSAETGEAALEVARASVFAVVGMALAPCAAGADWMA